MSIRPSLKHSSAELDIRSLKTIVRNLRHTDIRPTREETVASSAENARRLNERIARFVFGKAQ